MSLHTLIVGGGPGGMMLAYLLTRQGLQVTLLESQQDFDREFRGDTLTPSVMLILKSLGLTDRLLELPHSKIQKIVVNTAEGPLGVTDYSVLKTEFPYITVLPQVRFLEFLAREMEQWPGFRLVMGANVRELIRQGDQVRGVVTSRGEEFRADLVVAADGRNSRLRHLSGLKNLKTSPPMDVLWFRIPKRPDEPADLNLSVRIGGGFYTALTDRFDHWQISLVIPKGTFQDFKAGGIQRVRDALVESVPAFADRTALLQDWSQIFVLSVHSSRLVRSYVPGMLLIGDAAHTMSSVGGVGINTAIQDAVVASNVLGGPLRDQRLKTAHLREVWLRREVPVRLMQFLQSMAQKQVIERALDARRKFELPLSLRLPVLNRLALHIAAFGIWPVRVDQSRFLVRNLTPGRV